MSAPASSGPKTAPKVDMVELSALADGSSSPGTSRATTAPRVGMLIAKSAWLTASSARTSHTEPKFRNACSQSSAEVMATRTLVTTSSFRRSTASATAPPQSPKTSSGTRATSPVRPTYAEDPVRSKTCFGTATAVSWVPTAVTTVDSQSRRKAGIFSGRVSTMMRPRTLRTPFRRGGKVSGSEVTTDEFSSANYLGSRDLRRPGERPNVAFGASDAPKAAFGASDATKAALGRWKLRSYALDGPPVVVPDIPKPVVHPVLAPLPKLDQVRPDPPPAPVRRCRDPLDVREPALDPAQRVVQRPPAVDHPGLRGRPRPQLRPARPLGPVLRSLLDADLFDLAADVDLAVQRVPGERHRRVP